MPGLLALLLQTTLFLLPRWSKAIMPTYFCCPFTALELTGTQLTKIAFVLRLCINQQWQTDNLYNWFILPVFGI
jgi:hypothetical protein